MNKADKNAETVRRGYAAFNSGDMKTLTTLFDENASWHTPGEAQSLATTRAAARSSPNSVGMAVRQEVPSRPLCCMC